MDAHIANLARDSWLKENKSQDSTTTEAADMSSIPSSQTALLVVDIQQGLRHPSYYGSSHSNPQLEANVTALLLKFRSTCAKVVHVNHHSTIPESPLNPSSSGVQVEPYAAPLDGEPLFIKSVNCAFMDPRLPTWLQENGIRRLLFCGIATDCCISSSVRTAADMGIVNSVSPSGQTEKGEILVVGDATRAYAKGGFDAETVHGVHLSTLNGEYCHVTQTSEVLDHLKSWPTS